MKRNPKIFMAMAALALIGGGAGSYFQWSSLQDVQAKSSDLEKRMQEPNKVQRQLTDSSAKVVEFTEKLNHLEKGVPQMAYVATLLSELDQIGTENGIDVLGVRPVVAVAGPVNVAKAADGTETATPRKPYEELNIEVKGRGDYRSVLGFVQALQRFPKIVAARTISITPKVGQTKDLKLDIAIEIRAYLFPTTQAPAAGSDATDKVIQISGRNKEIL